MTFPSSRTALCLDFKTDHSISHGWTLLTCIHLWTGMVTVHSAIVNLNKFGMLQIAGEGVNGYLYKTNSAKELAIAFPNKGGTALPICLVI